ncbi:MAG: crotonase/enoyl-CoA hydratase family protein [Polyangiales bacterium]
MGDVVTYERSGGVSTIRIDDGKANAMSVPTMREISAAFEQASVDETVVVLAGREGLFSAGFDLKVFQQGVEPLTLMLRTGAALNAQVMTFPAPVVVACTGHAIAMGSFLLMSADYRIGADGPFRIGMNEVAIGMTLPLFAIDIATPRISPPYLSRSALLAQMYSPTDAIAPGFLDEVVAPNQVIEAAQQKAQSLSELDRKAHQATKTRIRGAIAKAVLASAEEEFGGAS